VHALPFLIALLVASLLAPALLRELAQGGHVKPNWRSRELPFPFGVLALAAAVVALVPLMALSKLAGTHVFHAEVTPIALYCLGVLCLGLLDDTLGDEPRRGGPGERRGWRGHGGALLGGELSTGVLKAVGCLGLAAIGRAQFTSFSDRSRLMLEGNWQSCREADGNYSERVFDGKWPGIGAFEFHMGPYRELPFQGHPGRPSRASVGGQPAEAVQRGHDYQPSPQSWDVAGLHLDVSLGAAARRSRAGSSA
jgi:hypothetical protein